MSGALGSLLLCWALPVLGLAASFVGESRLGVERSGGLLKARAPAQPDGLDEAFGGFVDDGYDEYDEDNLPRPVDPPQREITESEMPPAGPVAGERPPMSTKPNLLHGDPLRPIYLDRPRCEGGQMRWLAMEGWELVESEDSYQAASLEDCVANCPPIGCRELISFDGTSCRSTNSQFTRRRKAGTTILKKLCLTAETLSRSECPMTFVGRPQFTLAASATMLAVTGSVDACISECLNSQDYYSLPCSSVTYFPLRYATNFDCVLSKDTASSRGDLFVPIPDDVPVFYADNSCTRRSQQL